MNKNNISASNSKSQSMLETFYPVHVHVFQCWCDDDLSNDTFYYFYSSTIVIQLSLRISDTFYPYNYGYCNVRINVNRNPQAPEFNLPSYQVTINEYFPLGNRAVDVEAIDRDGVSVVLILYTIDLHVWSDCCLCFIYF